MGSQICTQTDEYILIHFYCNKLLYKYTRSLAILSFFGTLLLWQPDLAYKTPLRIQCF